MLLLVTPSDDASDAGATAGESRRQRLPCDRWPTQPRESARIDWFWRMDAAPAGCVLVDDDVAGPAGPALRHRLDAQGTAAMSRPLG